MNMLKMTEENVKQEMAAAYARAVALRQDCEEGFRTINPYDIRVFIDDNETIVEFPCLQVCSCAYWCAKRAAEDTSKRFYGNKATNEYDSYAVVTGVPQETFNLRTTVSVFKWRHCLHISSSAPRSEQ